jgi:dolichol-phosphate mannosyltransferase
VVGEDYELILLNDGSRDGTWAAMRRLLSRDSRLVLVNLSRRHGHQLALTAGLELCRGERILSIDSDLQDPPELLGDMWRLMDAEGADVVYGLRRTRQGETAFKRGTASLFYWLLKRIGYADIPSNAGDFRLMTRRLLDILNGMPEQHRFIRGMVSWIGLRQVALPYDRDPRYAGTGNYPLARMMTLALDALTAFSIMPLRIASFLGLAVGVLSLLMLSYTLGSWAAGRVVDGWTSLSTIVLMLGAIQLMLFGVLGEYVGRVSLESKRRPLYVFERIETQGAESSSAMPRTATAAPAARGE